MIVRLALLGGDVALDQELRAAARRAAGDRIARARRTRPTPTCCWPPTRRSRLQATSCGASAPVVRTRGSCWSPGRRREHGATRARLRGGRASSSAHSTLRACGTPWLRRAASMRAHRCAALHDEGHVALLGAGGGMGTTTCAVALAAAHERAFVLDLALACGDAAEVAGVHVAVPDALLRIACGPVATAAELAAGLAHGGGLPGAGGADAARARRSDRRAGNRASARPRSRERTSRGRRLRRACRGRDHSGARAREPRRDRRQRRCAWRARRPAHIAADRATRPLGALLGHRRDRLPQPARGAVRSPTEAGLPLLATIRTDSRVPRARERGLPPPGAAFAALAALAGAPAHESLGAGAAERSRGARGPGDPGFGGRAAGSAGRAAQRFEHHRGDRQRAGRDLDRAPRAACSAPHCASTTRLRCATPASAWRLAPVAASTTPSRWSTPASPTARA